MILTINGMDVEAEHCSIRIQANVVKPANWDEGRYCDEYEPFHVFAARMEQFAAVFQSDNMAEPTLTLTYKDRPAAELTIDGSRGLEKERDGKPTHPRHAVEVGRNQARLEEMLREHRNRDAVAAHGSGDGSSTSLPSR